MEGSSPKPGPGRPPGNRPGPAKQGADGGLRRETSAGAALGAQFARFSSIQFAGRMVGAVLAFGSTIVIVHFLGPGQLGQLALVFFLAQLLGFAYAFPTRVGTIRRVFGACGFTPCTWSTRCG